jgi:hypothetical protein
VLRLSSVFRYFYDADPLSRCGAQAANPEQHPVGKFEVCTMMGGAIQHFFDGLEARIGAPHYAPALEAVWTAKIKARNDTVRDCTAVDGRVAREACPTLKLESFFGCCAHRGS